MQSGRTQRNSIQHLHHSGLFLRRKEVSPAAPWLFYIHGLGESGLCFEPMLARPELAEFNQLVPDLPGYGRSLWPDSPPTLNDHAERLARLIEALRLPPVVLVGHSMGGAVGQLLAEREPSKIAAFVNVEGNLTFEDCGYSATAAAIPSEPEFCSKGYRRLLKLTYQNGETDPAFRGYYVSMRLCDPRLFYQNSCQLVELSRENSLASRMAALPRPGIYFAGLRDRSGEQSIQALERADVPWVGFESSGHWPFCDEAPHFAFQLREFVTTFQR